MNTTHNLHDVPDHIRASWSKEQREYFEKSYFHHPHGLGPEFYTAGRRLEMQKAAVGERDFFLGYWPAEAMKDLETFKRQHYDAPPTKGQFSTTSISQRVKRHYPKLFDYLDNRMAPLADAVSTHPHLGEYFRAYNKLKGRYYRKLESAKELTYDLEPASFRRDECYRLFKLAFDAIFPRLHELIFELASISR